MGVASRSLAWLGDYDAARWAETGIAVFLAVVVGLIAGVNPALAIAAALSLGFILLLLADLAIGIVAFTVLSFVALVPFRGGAHIGSFVKVAGLLPAPAPGSRRVARSDRPSPEHLRRAPDAERRAGLLLLLGRAQRGLGRGPRRRRHRLHPLRALALSCSLIVFSAVRERRHAVWVVAAFVAGTAVLRRIRAHRAARRGLARGRPPQQHTRQRPTSLRRSSWRVPPSASGCTPAFIVSPALRLLVAFAGIFCAASVVLDPVAHGPRGRRCRADRGRPAGPAPSRAGWASSSSSSRSGGSATSRPSPRSRCASASATRATAPAGPTCWTVGRRMVEAEPATGVGAGHFEVASIHYLLGRGRCCGTTSSSTPPRWRTTCTSRSSPRWGPIGLVFVPLDPDRLRVFSGPCDRQVRPLGRPGNGGPEPGRCSSR